MREHQLSIQRACRVVRLSRTAYYQPPQPASRRDAAVIAALTDGVARYPRWGFWKLFDRLRVEGRPWNHKHVHRVYCALRLNCRDGRPGGCRDESGSRSRRRRS